MRVRSIVKTERKVIVLVQASSMLEKRKVVDHGLDRIFAEGTILDTYSEPPTEHT
jgi:hypothetical protein